MIFGVWKKIHKTHLSFKLGCADLNIITKGYYPKPYKFHDFAHFVSIFARLKLHQYLLDFNFFWCSEKPWSQFVHFWGLWSRNLPLTDQKPPMSMTEFRQNPSQSICTTLPLQATYRVDNLIANLSFRFRTSTPHTTCNFAWFVCCSII